MLKRRTPFLWLSGLLALVLASGTALPSPRLWSCHHESRLVSVPLRAAPASMPCEMAREPSRAAMACCKTSRMVPPHAAAQSLTSPPCHPTFRLAALPAAVLTARTLELGLAGASVVSALPSLPASVPAPALTCIGPRPPPRADRVADALTHAPSLRAPPVA